MDNIRQSKKITTLTAIFIGFLFSSAIVVFLKSKESPYKTLSSIPNEMQSIDKSAILMEYTREEDRNRYQFKIVASQQEVPQIIELLVATDHTTPKLIQGTIRTDDGACIWQAEKRIDIPDNTFVVWHIKECTLKSISNLIVEIETEKPVALHIWTKKKPLSTKSDPFILKIMSPDNLIYPIASLKYYTPQFNREKIELLAKMWDEKDSHRLWYIIALGMLGTLLGTARLCFANIRFLRSSSALLWVGLSLLYVVLVPPFQAPDEPDHLLSFAVETGDVFFQNDLLRLANQGHLERIKFFPSEKFTSESFSTPLTGPWAAHISPSSTESRSRLTAQLWGIIAPIIKPLSTAERIFSLRLFNAIYVGLFLFIFLSVKKASCRRLDKAYVSLLFLIPTLLFFSMHVSNYFTTIGPYVGIGLFLARWYDQEKLDDRELILLGICVGLLPFSSATARASIVFWIPLILCMALTDSGDCSFFKKVKGLILFGLPILAWQILLSFNHLKALFPSTIEGLNVQYLKTNVFTTDNLDIGYLGLPFLFILRGEGNRLSAKSKAKIANILQKILTAALVFLLLYFLLQFNFPALLLKLRDIELSDKVPPLRYSLKTVATFWINLLPIPPDFYMNSSFWFGFGWLESRPQDWIISSIKILVMLGFFIVLISNSLKSSFSKILKIYSAVIGITLLLFGMAYTLSEIGINLHGRYLIPCYLILVGISALGIFDLTKAIEKRSGGNGAIIEVFSILLFSSILFIHAYSFYFLFDRYF